MSRFSANPEKFKGEPLIKLSNVWKTFHIGETETTVLKGIDLNVWAGDFVSIIGASGSGKSTLLNMIGLLDKPTSGKIFIKGKDVTIMGDLERADLRGRFFGIIFQQYNLIPWLNAYENAKMPTIFQRKISDGSKFKDLFEKVGLAHRVQHRPTQLSGGEQQRLSLIRALANDPAVILGDEPTGNLDSKTGDMILNLLVELHKEMKKTLVVVTHDKDIAEKADQIISLKDGQMIANHGVHKKAYTD